MSNKKTSIKKIIKNRYGDRYKLKGVFYVKDFSIIELFDNVEKNVWYQIIYFAGLNVIFKPIMFLSFYEALDFEVKKNKIIEYKK